MVIATSNYCKIRFGHFFGCRQHEEISAGCKSEYPEKFRESVNSRGTELICLASAQRKSFSIDFYFRVILQK